MTPVQRREAAIGFAMLPTGMVLVLAAMVGMVAALALFVRQLVAGDDDWFWYAGWSMIALVIGLRNLVGSLRAMAALDVRGTLVTLGWSVTLVMAYPGWWLV